MMKLILKPLMYLVAPYQLRADLAYIFNYISLYLRNFLFNPFSRVQIQLSSRTTIPYLRFLDHPYVNRNICNRLFIRKKAVLSLAPTPHNIAAVGICTVLESNTDIPCSELPNEVWGLILRRLNLPDYLRCSEVCVSWRHIVKQKPHPPKNDLPWLMLSYHPCSDTRSFFNLSEGRVYRIDFSEFGASRCCGSFEGWFVMVSTMPDSFPRNFLFNPFSRLQIQLPSQTTIPSYSLLLRSRLYIRKAVLSSAPTPDNIAAGNCIIVASVNRGGPNTLAFCRPGDEKWSLFEVEHEGYDILYQDIIYYNQKFYAVDIRYKLTVCEFDPHPKTIRVDIPCAIQDRDAIRNILCYLVESFGELLLIIRFCPFHLGRDGLASINTDKFHLFKFDASTTRWVEVESLGDCALFLGKNRSISLVASRYQELIRGNCIYFTGSDDEYGHMQCKYWYRDSAIFCLDDGSVKPYFSSHWDSYCKSPPIWITPNPW